MLKKCKVCGIGVKNAWWLSNLKNTYCSARCGFLDKANHFFGSAIVFGVITIALIVIGLVNPNYLMLPIVFGTVTGTVTIGFSIISTLSFYFKKQDADKLKTGNNTS